VFQVAPPPVPACPLFVLDQADAGWAVCGGLELADGTATDPVSNRRGEDFHCCKQKRDFCKEKADFFSLKSKPGFVGLASFSEQPLPAPNQNQNQHPSQCWALGRWSNKRPSALSQATPTIFKLLFDGGAVKPAK